MAKAQKKVLGIDLGTTNSVVAVINQGEPCVLSNAQGSRMTPSVINFTDEETYSVGQPALERVLVDPRHTVTSIKRFMGSAFNECEEARDKANYPVVRGPRDSVRVRIKMRERSIEEIAALLAQRTAQEGVDIGNLALAGVEGHEYSPEELSSFILAKLKGDAEAATGERYSQAVITVPAYFNDAQRQATRVAGRLAGLEVLRIISEPTAAALAYGIGSPDTDETVMVFDLGGGTFDVSILQIKDGVFRVLSTYGDNRLGGDDWDRRLIEHFADSFERAHGIDLRKDETALEQLHNAAIQTKIALTDSEDAEVFLPAIAQGSAGSLDLRLHITRREFERKTAGLRGRLKIPMDMAVAGAGIKVSDLDEVVLVGGSTRMPAVRRMVADYTGLEPECSVNPDEAVALGAAIQGGLLNGEVKGASLVDVTPLSLGIETRGGVMQVLIARNTPIPAHAEEVFLTTEDGQTAVSINVCQGERGIAADNKSLGRFRLDGIPPAPRGKAQIEVSFDIDANGVVAVCARELTSGVEQQISITGSVAMSEEEIARMLAEAELAAEQDADFARRAELASEAESLLYWTRKALDQHSSWLDAGQRAELESALSALEAHASEENIGAVRDARKPLEDAAHEAEAMKGYA